MKGIKGGSSQYHIPYQAEPLSLLSDSKNFLKRHEIASSNLSELLQICLQGERSDSPASLSWEIKSYLRSQDPTKRNYQSSNPRKCPERFY